MAELNWQGKSREMFQKLIEGSPKPFRAMTEKKMLEGLAKDLAQKEEVKKAYLGE